jgi:CRISPR/Cas system Type II protein with McrA/HNH and RuvC-like nuclease domain
VPLNKNADFNGQQIIKVKLYREQNGICPYSGKPIDFDTMLQDDNAYQIDHIVPFSRSNNDGITNKVLVLTEENQKKSNKTPFEYFGADENRWKEFVARVESIYKTRDIKTAIRHLLTTDLWCDLTYIKNQTRKVKLNTSSYQFMPIKLGKISLHQQEYCQRQKDLLM